FLARRAGSRIPGAQVIHGRTAVPAPSLQPTPCSTAIARQGPTTCHIANYGVQLRFKWETIVSGNSGGVAAQATFQYDVEFPVVPPARGALSAQRSRENREHSPAARGMKMAFEGSVRSGPNVWFIRDRGLLWENADAWTVFGDGL